MNNAASFNLLKFVEQRPVLSARKIACILLLWAGILMGYFLFQVNQFHQVAEASLNMEDAIYQQTQVLQSFLQKGENNPLVGLLFSPTLKNERGFYSGYAEFEALSHIHVEGLWLEEVIIHRSPPFMKITGAMSTPDKVNLLLQQLALQPAFKDIQFVGIDVNKGLLPDVPKQYQEEIKQLKIPDFYHFTLQTTPLKKSGASL